MKRNVTNTRGTDKYTYWIEGECNRLKYDVV